mmetsp:Transcript_13107/g.30940  ORF Transcript_13107/g.30940 Transcript_13107/m.30940 type:complete len:448 (+) Transcript_13107:480-1823(+)
MVCLVVVFELHVGVLAASGVGGVEGALGGAEVALQRKRTMLTPRQHNARHDAFQVLCEGHPTLGCRVLDCLHRLAEGEVTRRPCLELERSRGGNGCGDDAVGVLHGASHGRSVDGAHSELGFRDREPRGRIHRTTLQLGIARQLGQRRLCGRGGGGCAGLVVVDHVVFARCAGSTRCPSSSRWSGFPRSSRTPRFPRGARRPSRPRLARWALRSLRPCSARGSLCPRLAWLALGTGGAGRTRGTGLTVLAIVAVLAVEAVFAVEPVLARGTGLAILAVQPVLTVLAVDAVLAILSVGTGLSGGTGRAGRTRRATQDNGFHLGLLNLLLLGLLLLLLLLVLVVLDGLFQRLLLLLNSVALLLKLLKLVHLVTLVPQLPKLVLALLVQHNLRLLVRLLLGKQLLLGLRLLLRNLQRSAGSGGSRWPRRSRSPSRPTLTAPRRTPTTTRS